jgi:hypothetical protein
MGERARDIWIHYVRGNSEEGHARARELLRKREISLMDRAFMHLLLANDPSETGVPHAQEADRILTAGKAELERHKRPVHFDTLLGLSKQLRDVKLIQKNVNKSDQKKQ